MRRFLAAGLLVLVSVPAVAWAGVDQFYLDRLKAGKTEARLGRHLDAEEDLRIACFGLLDAPPLLVECLGRLVLAQRSLSKTTEMDATLSRLIEVEARFGVWEKAAFEPALRADLEQLLLKRLGKEGLLAVQSLSSIAVRQELDRIAALPPAARTKALEGLCASDPANPTWPFALAREAQQRQDWAAMARWATRAVELAPGNPDALTLRAHARVGQKNWKAALADFRAIPVDRIAADPVLSGDLFVAAVEEREFETARAVLVKLTPEQKARPEVAAAIRKLGEANGVAAAQAGAALAESSRLIQEGRYPEALKLLQPLLEAEPANRDLRKGVLEAAVLTKEWKVSAAQVPALKPFREDEESSMFYGAVALWESGAKDEARTLARKAYPLVAKNAFVEFYGKRILE